MATITERNGKFLIRVSNGRDGKKYNTTWPARGEQIPEGWSRKRIEKEVKHIAELFEEECRKGNVASEHKHFSEYARYVIDEKERTGAKVRTVEAYRDLLKRIESPMGIGNIQLDKLTARDLNAFYGRLGKTVSEKTGKPLSSKTCLEYARFISAVLSMAEKEGLVQRNVASLANAPKREKKEPVIIDESVLPRFIQNLEKEPIRWRALMHMLIGTGCRRGEVLGLRWTDINGDDVFIHNQVQYRSSIGVFEQNSTKTAGSTRHVIIPSAVVAILNEWKKEQAAERLKAGELWQDTGFIFTNETGSVLFPDAVTRWLARFCERYGMEKMHPHQLRHFQASLLISAGMDPVTVARRLGHSQVSTTLNVYSHLFEKADKGASDVVSERIYGAR